MIVGECSFEIKQNALNALKEYAQHDGNELCGVATGSQIGNNVLRISKISPPCIVIFSLIPIPSSIRKSYISCL